MERVAFLVESTRERLPCLLNPESVVWRRRSGVQTRQSSGGTLTGAGLKDNPLLLTGGGSTELTLDLLFDVSLAGSSIPSDDVRVLTEPLWSLAENANLATGYGHPPLVRFVWGKTWNIPGIVAAVAERLECFGRGGAPGRSWLRMRFLRVCDAAEGRSGKRSQKRGIRESTLLAQRPERDSEEVHVVTAPAGGNGNRANGERLDQIAYQYYGDPGLWRGLAKFNDISDPLVLSGGQVLRIPPRSKLEAAP